jgi:hypothetical protein
VPGFRDEPDDLPPVARGEVAQGRLWGDSAKRQPVSHLVGLSTHRASACDERFEPGESAGAFSAIALFRSRSSCPRLWHRTPRKPR